MDILIANVGERDLYCKVEERVDAPYLHMEQGKADIASLAERLKSRPGARHVGRALLERLDQDRLSLSDFRYPILKTVVDAVACDERKVEVVLVVTDQPKGTSAAYRDRDTLYTGEIIKRLIERDYLQGTESAVAGAHIESFGNEPRTDQAYPFFGTLLRRLAPPEDSSIRVHGVRSGGIPALNDALQDQLIRLYRDRSRLYEVDAPPEVERRAGAERGQLRAVAVKPFLRDLAVSIVRALIERYDYSGAREVLKSFQSVRFWDDRTEAVLDHAQRRLDLDFSGAALALLRPDNKVHTEFQHWYQTMERPSPLSLLVETFYVARCRWEHEEYAEFLWRNRMVCEAVKEEIYAHLQDAHWAPARAAHAALQALGGLANRVLHPGRGDRLQMARGVSRKAIDRAFETSGGAETVVSTLQGLVAFIWQQRHRDTPLPGNPFAEINAYLVGDLEEDAP